MDNICVCAIRMNEGKMEAAATAAEIEWSENESCESKMSTMPMGKWME